MIASSSNNWLQLPASSLQHLHGIVQTSDGRIWIQHAHDDPAQSCVLVCARDGSVLQRLSLPELPFPHGLEVYQHPHFDECLLHTDNKSGLVLMDLDGSVRWQLARPDFYRLHWTMNFCPSNSAIASDGRIFMADGYGTGFITCVDSDGADTYSFAGPLADGSGCVHPHGLGIIPWQGEECVAVLECQLSTQDPAVLHRFSASSCVKIFSLSGAFLCAL